MRDSDLLGTAAAVSGESLRHYSAKGCRFVMLEGSREIFEARLSQRRGHFMNSALLASQLATLELPENAIRVSVEQTPEGIAMEILERLSTEHLVLEPF
jgi:gluconate kinase